jgi:hypothetical protein
MGHSITAGHAAPGDLLRCSGIKSANCAAFHICVHAAVALLSFAQPGRQVVSVLLEAAMSKPLTIFLQLLALFLLLHGFSTGNAMSYVWAAICFIPAAIGIRKRLSKS